MRWQDFALVASRLLGILGFTLAIAITQAQSIIPSLNDLWIAAGVGTGLTLFAALLAFIASTRGLAPLMFVIADFSIAGGLIYVSQAQPIITVGVVAFLALSLALTVDMIIAGIYIIGLMAIALGLIVYFGSGGDISQSVDFGTIWDAYTLPIIALMLVSAGALLWAYADHRFGSQQQNRLKKLAQEREEALAKTQERARAITEMTSAVTATLDYSRILEAAMDIGDLTVRADAVGNQRVISMVLLFRDDNRLAISSSRGLKPEFNGKTVRADAGIIGKTLVEAIPTISADVAKDPVLGNIPGLRQLRSLLCVPLRAHYDNFGLLVYGTTAPDAFDPDHTDMLQAIGVQATVALQNAVLQGNLRAEKNRIMQMEEDARKSLVRDLHDVPTQTMSGVAMRLDYALRLLERQPEGVAGELQEIRQMAMRAVTEIRHVLFKLRPLALESQGLIAAVKQLAEKMHDNYNQPVTVQVSQDVENFLDEPRQGTLFYLIEEAVNNARKYAEASMITVKGGRKDQTLIVQITDNGKGFDMEATSADYSSRGSFGMVNMQERADLLDATLNLRSAPGKGTSITVNIPIINSQAEEEIFGTKLADEVRRNS